MCNLLGAYLSIVFNIIQSYVHVCGRDGLWAGQFLESVASDSVNQWFHTLQTSTDSRIICSLQVCPNILCGGKCLARRPCRCIHFLKACQIRVRDTVFACFCVFLLYFAIIIIWLSLIWLSNFFAHGFLSGTNSCHYNSLLEHTFHHFFHFLWQLGRGNAVENTAFFVPALAHALPFCLQWNDIFVYICDIIRGRFAACVFLFLLSNGWLMTTKKVGEYAFLPCGGKSWMWAYCTLMCKTWNLPLTLKSRFWSSLRYVQNPEVNIFFSKLLPLNIPPLLRSLELLIGDSYFRLRILGLTDGNIKAPQSLKFWQVPGY